MFSARSTYAHPWRALLILTLVLGLAACDGAREAAEPAPPPESPAIVQPGDAQPEVVQPEEARERDEALSDLALPAPLMKSEGEQALYSSTARQMGAATGYVANGVAPGRVEPSREGYAYIAENDYHSAAHEPLSTFSIDVDAASYSNMRRFIERGQMPPKDAIRIEELINYFSYDYPQPDGEVPFALVTEMGPAPWQPAHQLVHIGLQGRTMNAEDRPASNLVFLLDVSGSMNSPDKLPLLKQAFGLLVDQLTEDDRVSIAVYAGAAGLVLPPTPGTDRAAILEALNNLQAGGSTAGAAGIQLAYQTARAQLIDDGNNRVILATDGDFNVGTSSDAELIRLIEDEREHGVFLTVLGFGTGNLQDAKMEQIADHGNGNYFYIDGVTEAKKVLVNEIGGTLFTIAKDVKLQIEFNPAEVAGYRLIGYENRLLAAEDFADDKKDAGELGAGHTVTALYEIIPVGAETTAEVRTPPETRYTTPTAPNAEAFASGEALTVKLRYKQPDGDTSQLLEAPVPMPSADAAFRPSDDFTFSAAVAAFGLSLRDSAHKGNATPSLALSLAQDALSFDPHGYRAGFVELIERYQALADERPTASR